MEGETILAVKLKHWWGFSLVDAAGYSVTIAPAAAVPKVHQTRSHNRLELLSSFTGTLTVTIHAQ